MGEPEAAMVRLEIVVPRRLAELLEEAERRLGVTKEDIVARAIVRVLEELGLLG